MRKAGKRRRTGCATCRARRIKCDESRPRCKNCEKKSLDCKQANIIVPCNWREPPAPSSRARVTATPSSPPPNPAQTASAPASTWEVIQHSQHSTHTPPPPTTWPPSTIPSPPPNPITTESATLLRTYQHGIGPWMDVLDHARRYTRAVLRLALASPLILRAVCALAAKHLSLAAASPSPLPSLHAPLAARHYGEALQLLIAALPHDHEDARGREAALTATVLLGSYELLAAPSADYAKHLRGAHTLLRARGVDFRRASSLEEAGLWVFARQDVAMAVAERRGLLWPAARWGVRWGGVDEGEEDVWARKVLWLLARVVQCVFVDGGEGGVEGLLGEVRGWRDGLPGSFEGLRLKGALAEGLDEVWFPVETAATALLYYHMAMILLLEEKARYFVEATDQVTEQIQERARSIASICLSKGRADGVLVVAVNPLYYAIKHIKSAAMRSRLWVLMEDIETRLGFHTSSRLRELEAIDRLG